MAFGYFDIKCFEETTFHLAIFSIRVHCHSVSTQCVDTMHWQTQITTVLCRACSIQEWNAVRWVAVHQL